MPYDGPMDEPIGPEEAHRAEIMEAMLLAALTDDREAYEALNVEWERIEDRACAEDDTRYRFRFGDVSEMQRYVERGYCYHCQKEWVVTGVRFGAMVPGLAQMMHMQVECPDADDCMCWVAPETQMSAEFYDAFPYGWPNCLRCQRAEPICECEGDISYGACALVWRADLERGAPPEG